MSTRKRVNSTFTSVLAAVIFTAHALHPGNVYGTDLKVLPLWSSSSNNATSCFVYTDHINGENVTHFSGGQHRCSLRVTVPFKVGIHIQISEKFNLNNSFIYIERKGEQDLLDCTNTYVSVKEQNRACDIIFWHTDFLVNLQGNASLLIKVSSSDLSLASCPEIDGQNRIDPNVSHLTECSSIEGYNNTISCALQNDHSWWAILKDIPGICTFDFPSKCNVTFGKNKATFHCVNSYQSQKNIILYSKTGDVRALDLIDNNIIFLDVDAFMGLNKLQALYLVNNKLVALNAGVFHGLDNLKKLYLSNNQLVTLDKNVFENLERQNKLYLYGNRFVTLHPSWFYCLRRVTILSLYDNTLKAIPAGVFEDMENLLSLYLYGNQLVTVNVGLFLGLTRLDYLRLDGNRLSKLPVGAFHGLGNLTKLYLFENYFISLDEGVFQGLGKLTSLGLWKNKLNKLAVRLFHGLNNLENLYLFENQLVTLNLGLFQNMQSLLILSLGSNKLKALPVGIFQDTVNLNKLLLYNNELTVLDTNVFDNLGKLTMLSVRGNMLVRLNANLFQHLSSLKDLYLYDNLLTRLDKGTFQTLNNLTKLHLSNNHLSEVDSNLLLNKVHLTFLDLSENFLRKVPSFENLTRLNFLNLQGNPLTGVDNDTFNFLQPKTELFVSQHEICDCYVPANGTCSAASVRSPYLTCDRLLSDRVLMVFMWIIGLNALCGNVFVLVWRKKQTKKNKAQALLLSNLAMSDLLMGIYMIIIASADIYFGEYFTMQAEKWRSGIPCRIAGALAILSSEASVFFVTLISIDRFISIKYPHSTKTLSKLSAVKASVSTWTFAITLGIIPSALAGVDYHFYDNSHVCIGLPLALTKQYSILQSEEKICPGDGFCYKKVTTESTSKGDVLGMYFSTAVFLGMNSICYVIILLCYVEIVRTVYKSSKRARLNKDMKEQIRMTAKVAAIVATDFFCWFPVIVCGILVQAKVLTLPPSVFAWSVTIVIPINSAINPYLYTISAIISSRIKQLETSVTHDPQRIASQQPSTRQSGGIQQSTTSAIQPPIGEDEQIPQQNVLPNVPMHRQTLD